FDSAPSRVWGAGIGLNPPPEKRRVQIGWADGIVFPGMPFNQQMTIPVDLGFTHDGQTLSADPVIELEALHVKPPVLDVSAGKGVKWTRDVTTKNLYAILADNLDAFDLDIRIDSGKSKE